MNNLLHVSPNQYPPLNGKEHHTKNIWKELAVGFDEYHVLARSEDNRYSYTIEGNIHLHLIPKIMDKSKIFFISSIWAFYIIKKYEINRLLCQCPIVGGFTCILASKYFKIPIMVEIHGDVYFKYMNEPGILNRIYSFFAKTTFNNATKIRSLSSSMNRILNSLGIRENIVIIPNRVDLNLFQNRKDNYKLHNPIKVLSIGRFVEQKGYDVAIESIKILSKRYNLVLNLVGGGKLANKFKDQSFGYDNIKFIEWIDQSELKDLMSQTDIYIQPSKPYLGEAMPRTILEAMAMKLPIISTNIAAIPGVLNDSNSIVIKPNNVIDLVDAIEKLILNSELRERIALCGYQDVCEKYEWNKVFHLYREEIKSMNYENS